MIVAGRDESDFYDALGIVGAGPLGAFTGMLVYQNADGYATLSRPCSTDKRLRVSPSMAA